MRNPYSRPLRGEKKALRKCSSAFLAFFSSKGSSEALPLIAEKEKRGAFTFSGLGGAGRG
ncbi:hypothetical protein CQA49_04195 [Helicobacter sp. MIT 00-7814]|nr:hypothetical protein CQA49_04195 [Helicobacter sp. MIT 00-7814]